MLSLSPGLVLIADHVCSMSKDRVNFEDRILNEIRAAGAFDREVLVRSFMCSDAGDALRCIRSNDISFHSFRKRCASTTAYVLIGNTEKTKGGNRFWFSQYLLSIYEELKGLSIDTCFVYTKIKDNYKSGYMVEKESSVRNLEVYRVKGSSTWQNVAQRELRMFCDRQDVDLIEGFLSCPKQWDSPTKETVKTLAQKIADNFIEIYSDNSDILSYEKEK